MNVVPSSAELVTAITREAHELALLELEGKSLSGVDAIRIEQIADQRVGAIEPVDGGGAGGRERRPR